METTVTKPKTKHPLYRVWSSMIMRCENPNRPYYHLYGGRGIKVCRKWRKSYKAFYKWAIKNGYKFEPINPNVEPRKIRNKWTLDRIDTNGDYRPSNCRFTDAQSQSINTRADVIITYKGENATVKTFLKKYNATVPFFYSLLREGMTELEAIDHIFCLNDATV
jgi:hypothetical protein